MSYPLETFHVGDTVRVRQWEDIVEEYEVDEADTIKVMSGFMETKVLKPLCGQVGTITRIRTGKDRLWVSFVAGSTYTCPHEILEPHQEPEFSEDEFLKLLTGG